MKNTEKVRHFLPGKFVTGRQPVSIMLVGLGGTGSQLLSGLARMHCALRELGGPGLIVAAVDGDTVSPANRGRQLFSSSDIGKNKAVVLVTRVNLFFGLGWTSYPFYLDRGVELSKRPAPDILISAVDTPEARKTIRDLGIKWGVPYWLDTGNTMATGQAVTGTLRAISQPVKTCPKVLPTILDLYPEMAKQSEDPVQGPSCSVAEALQRQDLFINQAVATTALQVLWKGFRQGYLREHGAFVDRGGLQVRSLAVDPVAWERMGYSVPARKRRRLAKAA